VQLEHYGPRVDTDVLEGVDAFIQREVRPVEDTYALELGRTGTLPAADQLRERRRLRRRSAKAGFYGAGMPRDVGGGGVDAETMAHAYRVVGASGLLLADRGGVLPNVEGPQIFMTAMSEEQRARYLKPLMNAELEACLAITEPDAGSDATRLRTSATKDGDGWVINGTKRFITHGAYADFVQVVAVTDPDAPPSRRCTAFIVDRDTPGLTIGATHGTLGEDRPVDLVFDGVRVPCSALVGGRGLGLSYALSGIGRARLNIAALAIGKSEHLLGRMRQYANEREAFGQKIGSFQFVQQHIVDSSIEIEAALGILRTAAAVIDSDDARSRRLTASVKIYATETLTRVADRAIAVLGGIGVTHEGGVERFYRDARAMRIYEGTSELLRSNIAHLLGLPR
jgi:acyl-CoA dehydrogenase